MNKQLLILFQIRHADCKNTFSLFQSISFVITIKVHLLSFYMSLSRHYLLVGIKKSISMTTTANSKKNKRTTHNLIQGNCNVEKQETLTTFPRWEINRRWQQLRNTKERKKFQFNSENQQRENYKLRFKKNTFVLSTHIV